MPSTAGLFWFRIDAKYWLSIKSFQAQAPATVTTHITAGGVRNARSIRVPKITMTNAIIVDAPGETIASLSKGTRTIEVLDYATRELIWGALRCTAETPTINGDEQSANMTSSMSWVGEALIEGSKV